MADSNDLNPHDRAGLRKAADELLREARKEDRAAARADRARADAEAAAAADPDYADDGERDEWDDLLDQVGGNSEPGLDAGVVNEELQVRLEEAQASAAEEKERAMRITADMENLRRRTERELRDAKAFAVSNFARDMLDVADNLSRALDAVPEGSDDPALKGLKEGVEMTGRTLDRTLEKHGVRKLEPVGEKFDPNFHQAMFKMPDPSQPKDTVAQVVQPGYAIGPRVLRPAMVGVTEGGPKRVEQPPREEPNDAQADA